MSLSKGVELTVNRYRVTADRLTLDRTPHGIMVEGDGRVSFCPCADSPLSVGFTRATVAPPTDLLLRQATFRTCGVPVFWLPAYWVRSPNKVGLLTPKFAWRAADGPWIGTGLHVPLSPKVDAGDGTLELLTGAYLRGGVDLAAQLRTTRTVSLVRWDYLDRGMLELNTEGYRHFERATSLTWQIDALRGERGRTGPVSFESATRRYDRARAEWAYADGRSLYALGIHADVARATAFREVGQFGPTGRWAIGAALGDFGRVDTSVVLLGRMRELESANAIALHSSDVALDSRPGPLTVRWVNRERFLLATGGASVYDAGLLGTEVRAGLPLVRRYGASRRVAEHWFEPFLVGTAAYRGAASAYGGSMTNAVGTVQVGISNRLWADALATNGEVELRLGFGEERASRWRALAARWVASGTWLALGGDAGWGGEREWLSTLRARLGRLDKVALRARLEGRGALDATQIRWLFDEAWMPWQVSWFSRRGWMSAGDFDVALGRQVAVSGGVSYDVGARRWLTESVSAAYRHPCGCFAATSRVDRRVGRDGLDVLILLELMP